MSALLVLGALPPSLEVFLFAELEKWTASRAFSQ